MSFRNARRVANLTQAQVAEKLGISGAAVAQWETGETFPRASLLPKIAELYGCSVDTLFKPETQEE